MLITNLTGQDYWFGPLHLPGGNGQTLTVDDTSATSLYLTDDSVADAINFLYAQNPAKITVSGAAAPFPRPTGKPDVLHGDGSPEGLVYASEGTLFLRRDNANVYQKRSMVHLNTGWTALGQGDRNQQKILGRGYTGETYQLDAVTTSVNMTSGDVRAASVGLLAGDKITNIIFFAWAAISTITTLKVGVFDSSGNLLASSANSTTNVAANTLASYPLSAPYTIGSDGLYYLGVVVVATTPGQLGMTGGGNGKESAIGSGVKGALLKSGQTDIPSSLGTGQTDSPAWFGWN